MRLAERAPVMIGAVVLVILMFAFGYWLGGARVASDSSGMQGGDAERPADAGKTVASLEDLLPALEAKVAANPRDIDQRVLLARTYVELGKRDKGIQAFRALRKDVPKNHEVAILLATALMMEGGNENDLREARGLLDTAVRLKPAVSPMARLYQGEIAVRLGDRRGAVRIWSDFLKTLPAGDPSRAPFEQRIAELGLR